jgi:hypothetical protein
MPPRYRAPSMRSWLKQFELIVAAKRFVQSRLIYLWYGVDVSLERSIPAFAPMVTGSRRAVAELTVQSIQQTFPFLSEFVNAYCDKTCVELSAEAFCKRFSGLSAAERLKHVFDRFGSDKSTLHNYELVYASILQNPLAVSAILEIGLGSNHLDVVSNMGAQGRPGASLRAFRDFLPNATIFGADVDRRILFQDERIKTAYVDQTNLSTFSELDALSPHYDLIIDDGLHSPNANIATLIFGLRKLASGGWLIVEDINVSAAAVWRVVAALMPSDYSSYLITAKGALVFAIQRA